MKNYEYTKINRLNSPHKYMYSLYQGSAFLDAYFKDRIKKITNLKNKKYKSQLFIYLRVNKSLMKILDKKFSNDPLKIKFSYSNIVKKNKIYKNNKSKILSSFSVNKEINCENLLLSLIDSQLNKKNDRLVKFWLDLLIQRFEVTKKIYLIYKVNFRKGKGDSNIIHLYLMLAISLTLFFYSTKKIKYMNTLLKLSDLICSLDVKLLAKSMPSETISMILLIELLNIKIISRNNIKKNYEFK